MAETYAGGAWALSVPVAPRGFSRSELDSISCPASTECMAVGAVYGPTVSGTPPKEIRPMAELWNGQDWRVQRLPLPRTSGSLSSVSCAAPKSCTAVGASAGNSPGLFAEHWNGHGWRSQAIPVSPPLGGLYFIDVSCATTRTCTVTWESGSAGPFIAQAVGNHWTVPLEAAL